jgi:O-antigen/teichoic acid export membrane protein
MIKNKMALNSLIYLASNLLNSLIPFLLLPSYTNNLEPSELGLLSLFDSTLLLIVPIIMFGFSGVISVEYFKKPHKFTRYFSSGILIPLIIYLICLIISLLFLLILDSHPFSDPKILTVIITIAIFQVVTQIRLVLFQVSDKSFHYMFFQLWIIISSIYFTLEFVIDNLQGWEGRVWALFITYSFTCILSLISFIKEGFFKFRFIKLIYTFRTLKLGFPLVPHALGMLFIMFFDRYLIAYYWGVNEVGIYVVALQIGMGISLIQNSFAQAWGPYLFRILSSENIDYIHIKKISIFFTMFLFVSAFFLVVISPFIFEVFIGSEYSSSIYLIKYIAFGFCFTGMYKLFVNYIFFVKKNYLLARIALLNVSINALLNLILIPKYGAHGAGISFMLSMLFVFIITALTAQKVYPIKWYRGWSNEK